MNDETAYVLLAQDDLIPLALIAFELGETVDQVAGRFGNDVTVDDVGMRAVSASDARHFFTERAEQQANFEERPRHPRSGH